MSFMASFACRRSMSSPINTGMDVVAAWGQERANLLAMSNDSSRVSSAMIAVVLNRSCHPVAMMIGAAVSMSLVCTMRSTCGMSSSTTGSGGRSARSAVAQHLVGNRNKTFDTSSRSSCEYDQRGAAEGPAAHNNNHTW